MAERRRPTTQSIDDYLAAAAPDQRRALERLRRQIKRLAPEAEECINYGIACFRWKGKALVGFGAAKAHCTFFPMDGSTVAAHQAYLRAYDTSKGAIRFDPARPLPAALVRKLVLARLAIVKGKPGKERTPRPQKPRRKASEAKAPPASETVGAFLDALDHPLKEDFEQVRRIMRGISPRIGEGIKWNSVSFRTDEYFATLNLRCRDQVQLVFHRGAKIKDNSTPRPTIPDPAGLLRWLATDRCLVTLGAGKEVAANRKAFEAVVRDWIQTEAR